VLIYINIVIFSIKIMINLNNKIAVISNEQFANEAKSLSEKLSVPLLAEQDISGITDYFAVLVIDGEKISLQKTGKDAPGSIYVDFVSGTADHRRKFGGGKSQMLAKAVGLNKFKNPHILDATAGLGRDSFVLACLGCKVDMVERSPIINALLQDGLMRAKNEDGISSIINNMSLTCEDSYSYISSLTRKPDVIYLDPMFPQRDKSALVKKEMRILKDILGTDEDSDKLLDISLEKAKHRVVVKRPRKSPHLMDKKPAYVMKGKANRFDVYIIDNLIP